jgi:dihydrofolate reductase
LQVQLVMTNHLTLDGVMQSPGRADEDTRDGFEHGGWGSTGNDEVMGRVLGEGMARGGAILLGRRTYEDFHGFWPNQSGNPFTPVLNNATKYVASRTLEEPLPWSNSTLLEGDAPDAVERLKSTEEGSLSLLGSGELARSLMERNLIDRYVLMIHPLVLGGGRRLFPDAGPPVPLRLVDSVTTTKGVLLATYEPRAS